MITKEISDMLYRRAMFILKDSHAAEDIVQHTLIKLDEKLAKESDINPIQLKAWMYVVVRNQSLKLLRKKKNMIVVDPEEFNTTLDEDPTPYQVLDNREQKSIMHERLKEALKLLPERQQLLLKLQYEDKMSYKQIAEATGLTSGNIGFLINRSMKVLRKLITPQ